MLNRIIRFSLQNRIAILIAAVLVIVGGSYTASRMEVDVFPDLTAPTVVIMTEAGGMAPEEVEQTITFPIETAVNGSAGVRRVRSSSTTGFSVVWVEFDWDTDVYHARQTVAEKLSTISSGLPANAGAPVMGPQSSILGEMLFIGLTADSITTPLELRTLADAVIAPRLLSVAGVAQVSVIGGDEKEYRILLDPARMKGAGVSVAEVTDAIDALNNNVAGGVVYDFSNEYLVNAKLATKDVETLGKAFVKTDSAGYPVLLENVATIEVGGKEPRLGAASVSAKPGVLLTVTKQPNTPTIELTEKIDKLLADMEPEFPKDVKLNTDLYRQQNFIDSSIGNVKQSLIEGAIFVALILFIFLMNPRTTVISLVTIPLALLTTLLALDFMGLTINTMSIGGIAIAIGSLVDDAIVDVENVYKRLRENHRLPEDERKSVINVVFEASKEVRMPILNSTLIIAVSFVPLFFLDGMEGRMLVPLGIAFIVSLFASTLVALTLTPVLCSWLLSGKYSQKADTRVVAAMKRSYLKALDFALAHGKAFIGGAVALFVIALVMCLNFGRSFLPPFNEGSFTINVSAMPGISLEESEKIGERVEKMLLDIPEIKHTARKTGRAELDEHSLGANVSEIEAPFELKDRSKEAVKEEIRKKLGEIPGINAEIGQPISHRIDAMLSGTEANIAIKIFGENLPRMYALGEEIKGLIGGVEGLEDVNVELQVERPQLRIVPRREVMAAYGMTMSSFSQQLRTLTSGSVVSQVYEDNQAYDVTLKLDNRYRESLEQIGEMLFDTGDGRKVPLENLAEVTSTMGPNTINRENISRKLVVSANVDGRDQRSVVDEIKEIVAEKVELPKGYHVEYGGQFESEETASRTLLIASLFSILAIFLLLYNQFKNARQAGVVMINLPLALIGGVFAIALSSGVISIPAIIGFISLFGIATRNGMLLLDRYNELEHRGVSMREAVLEGSSDRLTPIIMTALTSALALVPLAAGSAEPGNEIQSPMAKVILGGLLTSTALNLFIIPIVHIFIQSRKTKNDNQDN